MTIFLCIFCLILFIIIGFLIWYANLCISKIRFLTETLEPLEEDIKSYVVHLKKIYELDMFYGDETLKKLLQHGKVLIKEFDQYKIDFKVFNGELTEEDLEEIEKQEKEEEKRREKDKYKIDIQREVDKDEEE